MVPGQRRLPDRPEPADHHPVPRPRVRRPGEPRLRLRGSPADDDRRHEAPRAVLLADDDPRAHGRGRRPTVRQRHPEAGLAGEPRRRPGGPGEIRSADRGRAPDRSRARRLHPAAPRRGCPRAAVRRSARSDRDRSGDRHRADRARPGIDRRLGTRHPDDVRRGAARLHPGGHPGAEADPVRSAEPSGVHVGDGGRVVAQRSAGGVVRREERRRHAHAVRPPQRHVGDGAGAPRRRGRDPPASRRGGVSAPRRGRGLSGRAGHAPGRAGGADAIEAWLETYGMRCVGEIDITRPRWSERPSALVPAILGNIRNFAPGAGERLFEDGRREAGGRSRSCWRACGPCRTGSGRPTRPR